MSSLESKKSDPLDEKTLPLTEKEEYDFLSHINRWSLDRKRIHHIRKLFQFKSFRDAIEFVNQVAAIAEELGHHPDIFISYQYVTISTWTKSLQGLTETDFLLAGKIDSLQN